MGGIIGKLEIMLFPYTAFNGETAEDIRIGKLPQSFGKMMPTLSMADARGLISTNLFTRKQELILIRHVNSAEELKRLGGSYFYK